MPSPSVVQAIVNGQSFSVKASDIKFSLGDDTESATDWVHALIGPKTLRVPHMSRRGPNVDAP